MIAFLGARLDEDAAEARFVHVTDCSQAFVSPEHCECDCGVPARVLREVEAGRRLICAYHDRAEWAREFRDPDTDYENVTEAQARWEEGAAAALLAAIQFRAAVYSDNPDYRQEWKP